MPAYSNYGALDTQPSQLSGGDKGFIGVNMRTTPELLPDGIVAKAVNKVFANGEARTRKGALELKAQRISATILGAGLFSNPNGYEGLIVATSSTCYVIRDGTPPVAVALPSGTTLTAPISFTQAFDKVLLFRGVDATPLEWDGDTGGDGFVEVTQSGSGTGTLSIPGSINATSFANRLFLPYQTGDRLDGILVSDILDYTRYVPVLDEFRINFGTSDDLTRIFPYGQSVLVCFKTDSISYLRNVYADLADVAAAEVTREVGLVASNAVVQLGSAVWFLGRGGLYKFVPGDQDKVELESTTLSAPMQPFFDELNWREIDGASMAVDEERIYIALPYGLTATTFNSLAVYNHVTSQWEGYHTFPSGADCAALIETYYLGKRRVWWVDRTGKFLILNEDLGSDYYGSTHTDISDELLTRGYCASNDRKKFNRLTVGLKTWGSKTTISVVASGPGEETTIASQMTPDRTEYVVNLPDYDITNANDDFEDPYREDYQILAGDGAAPESGVYGNLHAEKLYRARINKRANYLQLRITNTQGSCTVTSAAVEGLESDRATISYA